jgi:hypothetical protein
LLRSNQPRANLTLTIPKPGEFPFEHLNRTIITATPRFEQYALQCLRCFLVASAYNTSARKAGREGNADKNAS